MTGSSIPACALCLLEIRSAAAYQEIAPMIEMIQALSSCYRLATSGAGSSILCARLVIGFAVAAVIAAAANFASRRLRHPPAALAAYPSWRSWDLSDRRFDAIDGKRPARGRRPWAMSSSDLERIGHRL